MKEKYQLLAIGPGEDEVVYAAQCEMTARTECEHNKKYDATQCEHSKKDPRSNMEDREE